MTPDLVALTKAMVAAKGVDATMAFFGSDAVWDRSPLGLEVYEGWDAIRRAFEQWIEIYGERREDDEEIVEIGNGVVFSATRPTEDYGGRALSGGSYGYVFTWIDGKISRVTIYADIDEARAAAERLAGERE